MQGIGRDDKGTGKVPLHQTTSAKQFALSDLERGIIMEVQIGICGETLRGKTDTDS